MPHARTPDGVDRALTFNVSTLLIESIGSTREHGIVNVPFGFDGFHTTLAGTLTFVRTDGSILIRGELALSIEELCGRCLESFINPIRIELAEEFWPPHDPATHQRIEVPEERTGFPIVDGELDLREAVRQYVEMARPMRPVCGAQCRGTNLAASASPTGDQRWAALESLRNKLGDD